MIRGKEPSVLFHTYHVSVCSSRQLSIIYMQCGPESPFSSVHRENGDIKFLTKGDNNAVDDRGLYKQGQHWLEKKDVVGRARG